MKTQTLTPNDWIKRIERFYVFDDDLGVNMLFVTIDDRVYGLGANLWGSLGLGHNQWVSEPQEIIELRHKKCINFLNGEEFLVFVSSDNCLYSCGYNRYGQLGKSSDDNEYKTPMIVQINANNDLIRDVSCGSFHTLIVTENNNEVYGWGSNTFLQIGSRDITCDAIIRPEKIEFNVNYCIKSVHCFDNSSFALTSDGQVFSWGHNRDNQLGLNSIDLIIFRPQLICNLSGITSIQSGVGETYFSSSNKNEVYFCGLTNDIYLKELENMTKITAQYLVNVIGVWGYNNCIYIQMEYCLMSLKDGIKLKTQVFNRKQSLDEPMDCMEYYITCEILLEVLECVRYLHELKPPVIHRDLKPDNILIADDIRNGRFIKLCDLGLITVHEMVSQSHTSGVGSPKYMAPEVISGRKYDTKADVYSISVIIEELFDTNVNDSRDKYIKHEWSNKYCKLLDVINESMKPIYDERPTCAEIIEQYNEWAIDSTVVTSDIKIDEKLEKIKHKERELRSEDRDSEPEFWEIFYTFVNYKLNYNQ
ncbi:uncharacterized protein LOC128959162 [Oppia nitens]|uniref:uncharacterized protein LOC128959162 n=1 Tax=Oppia nitens TaxID=1686743 RepID=UPI0023DC4F40|nr:uncharacterized protein LOC128959162 [Oppia nitens]